MMFEAGCIEIFSKNMAFDKLFSSVQDLMTFQLSRFDHTEATIDTSWVQFNVFFPTLMTTYICLRRFEAGVETFPHISH